MSHQQLFIGRSTTGKGMTGTPRIPEESHRNANRYLESPTGDRNGYCSTPWDGSKCCRIPAGTQKECGNRHFIRTVNHASGKKELFPFP